MVRVASLREQSFHAETAQDHNPDGLKAISQLRMIWARTQQLVADQYRIPVERGARAIGARHFGCTLRRREEHGLPGTVLSRNGVPDHHADGD